MQRAPILAWPSRHDHPYKEKPLVEELAVVEGKSYPLSCRAFNVAAADLMTVGSLIAQDPTIIKLTAMALNALQLNG